MTVTQIERAVSRSTCAARADVMTEACVEYGFYRYGGQTYFDKYDAFDAAIAARDWDARIAFVFPKAETLDWTIEPPDELPDLYAARARAIREQYDHLILMYSGGADSHQVLATFLDNGIHLDEVCHVQPMGFIEKLPADATPDDPLALLHEYRRAAAPGLAQVGLSSPRTKVRVIDTTWGYLEPEVWREAPHGTRVSGGTHGLYHAIRRTCEGIALQRIADRLGGKRVAVIHGNERPHMRLVSDDLAVVFPDSARYSVEQVWQHNKGVHARLRRAMGRALYAPLMFYMGEPVITLKQAHVIKRFLKAHPEAVAEIRARNANVYLDGRIAGLNVGLIYPDWDFRFQKRIKRRDAAILRTMLGEEVKPVVAERDRFYNERYGRLNTINRIHGYVRLTDTPTRLYRIGTLE